MKCHVTLTFSAECDKQPTIHGYVAGRIDIDTGKVQISNVPLYWDDVPYVLEEDKHWIREEDRPRVLECVGKLTKEEIRMINEKLRDSYWDNGELMDAVDSVCKAIGEMSRDVRLSC